jgi:HD-GYP domain-containing protein (c-di-GMP phosphodiesterase class II)
LAANSEVRCGYLMHDIGKIAIPDRILLKPSALTRDEKRIMETHTELGEYLIASLRHLHGVARQVIVHLHERWDGAGYPAGLAGEEIPLAARIFAVADAFDVLTSDRLYRLAASEEEALLEIRRHAGTQFDPAIVWALLDARRGVAAPVH